MASLSTITREPRCKVCNNLDHQGHQETIILNDALALRLTFAELDRDCPFCCLIISSIESLVDKDCWNARVIDPENGDMKLDSLSLNLVNDGPITVHFIFAYRKPNQTMPDANNMRGSSENASIALTVKFLIYSGDEVCLLQGVQ